MRVAFGHEEHPLARRVRPPGPVLRGQLRIAYDMLSGMGVDAFAERARRQLPRPARPPASAPSRPAMSSPSMRTTSRDSRDGLSNPEIGARRFISPRATLMFLAATADTSAGCAPCSGAPYGPAPTCAPVSFDLSR